MASIASTLLLTSRHDGAMAATWMQGAVNGGNETDTKRLHPHGNPQWLTICWFPLSLCLIRHSATTVKMSEKEAHGVAEKKKSFCTKESDTVSSEIGKAYGKTTYLATTFKIVPRGTEGAMSVEGTLAGLLASFFLASVGCFLGQIIPPEAVVCVVASQIANLGESISFQDKEGFKWLSNDVVNVINISLGSIVAILMQQFILQSWVK